MAVVDGFNGWSRDTEFVALGVGHDHPPSTVLVDAANCRGPGDGQFGDLCVFVLVVGTRPNVEVNTVLRDLWFRHSDEQDARTDSIRVDDRPDRPGRWHLNAVGPEEVFP